MRWKMTAIERVVAASGGRGGGQNFTVRFINILIYTIAYLIIIFVKVQKYFIETEILSHFLLVLCCCCVFLYLWNNAMWLKVDKCVILDRRWPKKRERERNKQTDQNWSKCTSQKHRSLLIKDDIPICKCAHFLFVALDFFLLLFILIW